MKKAIFGNEVEKMPDLAFRLMQLFFRIYYFFRPAKSFLLKFGIIPGSTVIDYGCGTGACIRDASLLVGETGTVYAADVHEMAIASVEKLKKKYKLANVITVLTTGNKSVIRDDTADLIYALDMFHMVKESSLFLRELCRIIKPGGILIIEDGHQPRSVSKEKILKSGCWTITAEEKKFLRCKPVRQVV